MPRGGRRGLRSDRAFRVITLQVNGKKLELEGPTPLLAYLAQLGVNPRAIALEHNGDIIERAGYEGITLRNGDVVEIVRMVGGGFSESPADP
jgi:sulfur carrier protein